MAVSYRALQDIQKKQNLNGKNSLILLKKSTRILIRKCSKEVGQREVLEQ
jgi:hypothetical protein